jgi:hypothetical protein
MDVVIGADDAVRRLVEQDRLLGDRGAGLGGVIGEVEADRDEVADVPDAGADSRRALDERQRFRRSSALSLASEAEVSALPARSGMTPDRSRSRPWHPAGPVSPGRVRHSEAVSRVSPVSIDLIGRRDPERMAGEASPSAFPRMAAASEAEGRRNFS